MPSPVAAMEGITRGLVEDVDEVGAVGEIGCLGDVVVDAGAGDEVGGGEAFEGVDDTMGGKDGDTGCVHVDEGHHHGSLGERWDGEMTRGELLVFVTGLVERKAELGGTLLGVGDGGLVTVVAVGDDELFVGHGGDDEIDEMGVGELPEAVDYIVFIGDG